jgi:hypothetical protein
MGTTRLFSLSGVAFVALVVAVVVIVGSTPGTDASAQELASFYSDNAVRQWVGTFALSATAPFILLFGIGLATAVGSRGLSRWGYLLLAGSILVAGSALLTAFVHFALASGADEELSPAALQALNSLDGSTWVAFNAAFGVMMLGAAGLFLSASGRRWLGWIALVLGIACFIPVADFFALLLTLAWIVVTSVTVARRVGRAAPKPLRDADVVLPTNA